LAYFSPQERWAKLHLVDGPGAPVANAWTMVEDGRGRLWVSAEQGLYRMENGHWDHIDVPATRLLHAYPLLAPAADGTLWIQGALPKPLIRVRVQGTTAQVVESVDQRTIESDDLTFLARDGRGWLWVGTDAGAYFNDGSRWIHVTEEDGLVWNDTDANSFLADADGSVWIGTSGGLAHLLHPEDLVRARSPAVRVTHAEVGGVELREHELVTLGLRRPTLSASLFSTAYDRPKAVEFHYQLEGLDPEWQPVQGEVLRISQLPAGRYTLRIIAVDSRRHVQSLPAEFPFEILRPWWQRTWFRVGERIGVLLMVLFFWRASVRLLVSRQHELESLVSLRTRELEREKVELLEARTTLIEMNRRDALTGLLNRSAIFEQLARERERAVKDGGLLAVVMADLDHFKEINDRYGHLFGDTVIRVCAERLQETLRPGDSVGRYGGEELLLLIPGLRPESAEIRMEELRRSIADEPVRHGEIATRVSCSFGLAWVEATGGTPEQEMEAAIASADAALYQAKQNGRNQVVLATTALMSEQ
jgi:diguanylate cyclase (GGDEF)-like protein